MTLKQSLERKAAECLISSSSPNKRNVQSTDHKCFYCRAEFSSIQELNIHEKLHANTCRHCFKVLKNPQDLAKHTQRHGHRPKKPSMLYKCKFCRLQFYKLHSLQEHIGITHNSKEKENAEVSFRSLKRSVEAIFEPLKTSTEANLQPSKSTTKVIVQSPSRSKRSKRVVLQPSKTKRSTKVILLPSNSRR